MYESKIPFPTMFITSSLFTPNFKTKGVPGLPGYWKDVHPSRQNFHQGPLKFRALFHMDIQLMKMCKRKRCQITVKSSRGRWYTNL